MMQMSRFLLLVLFALLAAVPGMNLRADPAPADSRLCVTLRLELRDKTTQAPITKAWIAQSETEPNTQLLISDNREVYGGHIFELNDPRGQFELASIRLSEQMTERWEQIRTAEFNPAWQAEQIIQGARLSLIVQAEGYVRQAFSIPYELANSGKRLVFELEPEARVRGRLIGPQGEPLTTQTLTTLLPQLNPDWPPYRRLSVGVFLRNETLETGRWEGVYPIFFKTSFSSKVDQQGVFEMNGLRPSARWHLRVGTCDLLPNAQQTEYTLQPGLNDLGEIKLELPGVLQGQITDEEGQGVDGAVLSILPSGIEYVKTASSGGQAGCYRTGLQSLQAGLARVRLMPPWGQVRDWATSHCQEAQIAYDALTTLPRHTTTTLSTVLPRGHTLWVEIPASPLIDELITSGAPDWSNPLMHPIGDSELPVPFSISGLALQSLTPNAQGFIYHQWCCSQTQSAQAKPAGRPIRLRADHVPPGPLAVCVMGIIWTHSPPPPSCNYRTPLCPGEKIPVAYAQVEMLPTTTTCQLRLNPVTLTVLPPPGLETNNIGDGPFFELMRTTPLSTFHRSSIRSFFTEIGPFPTPCQDALVGYVASCTSPVSAERWEWEPRAAKLLCIPPGTYELTLLGNHKELFAWPAAPCWQTTLQVPATTEPLTLTLALPPPSAGPTPRTQSRIKPISRANRLRPFPILTIKPIAF